MASPRWQCASGEPQEAVRLRVAPGGGTLTGCPQVTVCTFGDGDPPSVLRPSSSWPEWHMLFEAHLRIDRAPLRPMWRNLACMCMPHCAERAGRLKQAAGHQH